MQWLQRERGGGHSGATIIEVKGVVYGSYIHAVPRFVREMRMMTVNSLEEGELMLTSS